MMDMGNSQRDYARPERNLSRTGVSRKLESAPRLKIQKSGLIAN